MPDYLPVTFEDLKHKHFRFFHQSGPTGTYKLELLPDGTVGGYDSNNESFWQIENGTLSFLNKNKVVTVRFTAEIQNGKYLLKGPHLPNPAIILCLEEQDINTPGPRPRLKNNHTATALAEEIRTLGWSIGDHTYGKPAIFFEKTMAKLVIGKYGSIASGVKIAFGNHRTDFLTSYPFAAMFKYWDNIPPGVNDHATKGDIIIGNDVWIGADAFIGSGVTIGDGAVIGAMAVVTKNVPPYAIVGGNPAKIIRYRFDQPTIEKLRHAAWWDLTDDQVDSLIPLLLANDAPALITAIAALKNEPAAMGPDARIPPPSPPTPAAAASTPRGFLQNIQRLITR